MHENQCRNCQYYIQHYAFENQVLFRVHCGHCMKPGVRRKLPDAKVCERFVLRSPEEQVFASKEYLSRKLLEHVLSMELLPEIKDKSPEKVKSQPSRREAGKEE